MPLKRFLLPVAILALAALLASAMALNRPPPERRPPEPRLLPVEVLVTATETGRFTFSSQGNVQPLRETGLVAEVSGRVLDVAEAFQVGAFVAAGTPLLRIDPRDYETAVARAEAALAGRIAQLEQERARATQAERDWRSMGRGEASPLVLRTPFVAEAEAAVRAAEADLDAARVALERTTVRAPYDGLIRARAVDLGQFVAVGTALGRIAGVERVEVRLPLSEAEAAFIELPKGIGVGPEITLESTGPAGRRQWPARIVRSEGVVDTRTRLIHVVAEVEDPYALRRPGEVLALGSFVQARIPGRPIAGLIPVPRGALRGADQLVLVDASDRIELRRVEVVFADAERAWISTGIEPGERVVTTVLESPVPGTAVRVLAGDGRLAALAGQGGSP